MDKLIATVRKEFENRFGEEPVMVKSPGRVNLVGGHTDYNLGFVLPAAVESSIVVAIAKADTNQTQCYAMDKSEGFEADLSELIKKSGRGWPNYLLGVVDQLQKRGYDVPDFHCVFSGNVPIGAGMSSSAALEGGIIFGLNQLMGWNIDRIEMAHIGQDAENQFVGVQCGIMDQFSSLNGKKDYVIKLDCRSLNYEYVPFKQHNIQIVLCDTQIRRELATSEYNIRRSQCEEGVRLLQEQDSSIQSLRDVTPEFLNAHRDQLTATVYNRCKYVVEENERVLQACRYLERNDLAAFGRLMVHSHDGLRDLYEVSCKELDLLIEQAQKQKGVLGARMMGGGFGGCTINLVEEQQVSAFKNNIEESYNRTFDRPINIYQTNISDGTHAVVEEKIA